MDEELATTDFVKSNGAPEAGHHLARPGHREEGVVGTPDQLNGHRDTGMKTGKRIKSSEVKPAGRLPEGPAPVGTVPEWSEEELLELSTKQGTVAEGVAEDEPVPAQ